MSEGASERADVIKQAVANERLEGLSVPEDAQRIADNYVVGKASASAVADKIRQRYGIKVA